MIGSHHVREIVDKELKEKFVITNRININFRGNKLEDKELKEKFVITNRININFRGNKLEDKLEALLRKYDLQFEKGLAPNLCQCQLN